MNIRFRDMVFTPLPKVACTTLKHEYLRIMNQRREASGKPPFRQEGQLIDIHIFYQKSKYLWVSEQVIAKENLFHFTFVRDPYDRFVSAYLSKIKNKNKLKDSPYFADGGVSKRILKLDDRLKGGVTFSRFVEILKDNKKILTNDHFTPQSDYISEFGWKNVKFIGNFETIDRDWESLCKEIGEPYIPLKKLNASKNNMNYREFYDPHTRKLVEDIYGEDIERFKYTF